MHENIEFEKYISVSSYFGSIEKMLNNLEELKRAVKTAGGEVVGSLYQKADRPDPKTYLGSGKIDELREKINILKADAIICDDELTPVQMANLQQLLDIKVIDRTVVILDIFALRAKTKESKLQIELAQLSNYYTHLKGSANLSRLGGGIGTRGPGEKKLELDRRYIRNNINNLRHELKELKKHNEVINLARRKSGIYRFAIVGYTNAGKSTFLNLLTDAGVLSENKLFATVDTTTREFVFPSRQKVLVTDTVGFINKLPHKLIESFTSTLEDAKYADALIHVVDASDEEYSQKMHLVYDILKELGIKNKPIITVFNKTDKIENFQNKTFKDPYAKYTIKASFIQNLGVSTVVEAMQSIVRQDLILYECIIPYTHTPLIKEIRDTCQLIKEDYVVDGIKIKAYINEKIFNKIHVFKRGEDELRR